MAKDLKKSWFQAVQSANVIQISRFLYSTPSPAAGLDRMEWRLSEDESRKLRFPVECEERKPFFGGDFKDIDALSLSILLYHSDNVKQTRRKELMDCLVSAANKTIVNHAWGAGNSALHLSSLFEDRNLFETLIGKGADEILNNDANITPLQLLNMSVSQLVEIQQLESNVETMELPVECHQEDISVATDTVNVAEETIVPNEPKECKEVELVNDNPMDISLPQVSDHHSFSMDMEEEEAIATELLKQAGSQPPFAEAQATNADISLFNSSKIKTEDLVQSLTSQTLPDMENIRQQLRRQPRKLTNSFNSGASRPSSDIPMIATVANDSGKALMVAPSKITKRQMTPRHRTITPVLLQNFLPGGNPEVYEQARTQEQMIARSLSSSKFPESDLCATRASLKELMNQPMPWTDESKPLTTEERILRSNVMNHTVAGKETECDIPRSYSTIIKKTASYVGEDDDEFKSRPSSPKKNVHFGSSWKGTLESRRTFVQSSVVGNTQREVTGKNGSVEGQLLIHFVSMRGLVMNMPKLPEGAHFYCVMKCGDQTYFSKPIQCCAQNMYTAIPLSDDFKIATKPSSTVLIELRIRTEGKKHNRFSPRRMLQLSTGSIRKFAKKERPASTLTMVNEGNTHDSPVCMIQFRVEDVMKGAMNAILNQCWNWSSLEQFEPEQLHQRPLSRSSSRLMEVGQYLFTRFNTGTRNSRPTSRLGDSTFEVSEAGSLQVQLFYLPSNEASRDILPTKITDVPMYLERKKWFESCWFEGFLNQQGGDLKNWRRRWFKLVGAKMEAFHEYSREFRTTIDLNELIKIKPLNIDLDGEAYPMKYSFRLLFKHGEHIDFYADNKEKYDEWLNVLERVVTEKPEEPVWNCSSGEHEDPTETEASPLAKKRPNVTAINWEQASPLRPVEEPSSSWFSSQSETNEEELKLKLEQEKSFQANLPPVISTSHISSLSNKVGSALLEDSLGARLEAKLNLNGTTPFSQAQTTTYAHIIDTPAEICDTGVGIYGTQRPRKPVRRDF